MAGNVIRYTLNIKLSITFLIRKEKQIITVIHGPSYNSRWFIAESGVFFQH